MARPVPTLETGGVLLSYASEDLPAARNLHDALRAARLDVWLPLRPATLRDLARPNAATGCLTQGKARLAVME
jgi:hypothetical protein